MHISRKILSCLSIFCLSSFCVSVPECSAEFIQQEQTTKVLKMLVFTDKKDVIGNKWEMFLQERTRRYSNNDYQAALQKIKSEYEQSYASLSTCIEDTNKKAKLHSSAWIADLQKQYDREYLQENYDTIRFIVMALSMNNNIAACSEQEKEALYHEYKQLDAAKYYIKKFVEFSNTLNKEEMKQIETTITASKSYLNDFDYPLQSTLTDEGLKVALNSVALNNQRILDPRLMDFFANHPFFMKPFALGKAFDDLKAIK